MKQATGEITKTAAKSVGVKITAAIIAAGVLGVGVFAAYQYLQKETPVNNQYEVASEVPEETENEAQESTETEIVEETEIETQENTETEIVEETEKELSNFRSRSIKSEIYYRCFQHGV